MAKTVKYTIYCGFSSLSDIDKITQIRKNKCVRKGFSSLSDIDKITLTTYRFSYEYMF